MNEQVQKPQFGGAENGKLAVAIVLVLAGVSGFYVLGNQGVWVRWGAVAAGLVLGALIFASSERGRAFWRFVLDSRIELRKVVWPTRQETGLTTVVVFVFVILAGVFFWALDLFLAWAMRLFTGGG